MEAKDRFKRVREHYGLSMAAFGGRIGLSASGVSAIEYGTRSMGEKHIKLIHAAFPEISEEWLRDEIGDMIPQTSKTLMQSLAETYSLTDLECDIIQAFLDMDPDQQAVFLNMARSLKQGKSVGIASKIPIVDAAHDSDIYLRYNAMQELKELEQEDRSANPE